MTKLPVGDASRAGPLPYWPRYSAADSNQRALYLDWMASGRSEPGVPVGYVFIFFYGLERRVFVDDADEGVVLDEVARLQQIYGNNGSFRGYSSQFLAFVPLRHPGRFFQIPEAEMVAKLRRPAHHNPTALAAVAAWYLATNRPLPAEYAALVACGMENAKRGAVVSRSAVELTDLFYIRYRETFGEGVRLEAAKRPLTVTYQPASATLLGRGPPRTVTLPDVLGKGSQFRKLVGVWNDCVDDLRKANARKRGGTALDGAGWAALPAELRAEYDHPDQDKWDEAISATPVLADFHIATIGQLADLTGIEFSEKVTPGQTKKVAARAADVGYAIEPEPRLQSKAMQRGAEVLVWRTPSTEVPDAKVYGAVFRMLSLAMKVAMADGIFEPAEEEVVNAFLAEMFTLDEAMRTRIEAMKQLMARDSASLGAVAKALRATRTQAELGKIGAVLLAIAAADGVIAEKEEEALRLLYRSLGLPASDLAAVIARTGARLERDGPVEVQRKSGRSSGVPIPAPPGAMAAYHLNEAAIAAIVADTKEVAAILADVFDTEGDVEPSSVSHALDSSATPPAPVVAVELPRASEATTKLAQGLDVRYHAVLEELLTRPAWTQVDVRGVTARHRLMPDAVLDTINGWADDVLGDFLIEDAGEWKIHRDLLRAHQ